MKQIFLLTIWLAGCTFGVDAVPVLIADDDASVGDDAGDVPDLHAAPDGLLAGESGWPCASAQECASGFCSDGVCCDESCDPSDPANLCKACNVPGQEGQCVAVADGTDPRDQCPTDPATSCGHDGQCNGNGQCRLYTAGTVCGTPSCSNGVETYAPACDGQGQCGSPETASCYPYICADATRCATTCSSMAQCATGIVCDANGSCGKYANGQPCTAASDCQSAQCQQGVCCASTCNGTCFACNLPGKQGTCAPVPNGQDPLNQCAATDKTTCGKDGFCDGSGACRLWKAGTVCGNASCKMDARVSAPLCDGLGTCKPGTATDCGNYTCNPTNATCFTACLNDKECAKGQKCVLPGKCQ
jgi:hypothetical protein